MTPEQQRIKIAEACGWVYYPLAETWNGISVEMWQTDEGEISYSSDGLPDYLNDLNAMHEAEKILTEDQRYSYAFKYLGGHYNAWNMRHATATQLAEAFLRTLGLWEEQLNGEVEK